MRKEGKFKSQLFLIKMLNKHEKNNVGSTTGKGLYLQANRLESYVNWPHDIPSKLQMAESGFVFCGTNKELDLVRCYYCQKELDYWEPDDNPWTTHFKHCAFANQKKMEDDMTVEEFLSLECSRIENLTDEVTNSKLDSFKKLHKEVKQDLKGILSKK